MSYDIRLFFPHETFPMADWLDILGQFGQLREDEDAPEPGTAWIVSAGGSGVCASVTKMDPTTSIYCEPLGTRWWADVGSSSGCSEEARYARYAIPLYVLDRIPFCTVHDCQRHVQRQVCDFRDVWTYFEAYERQLRYTPSADDPHSE